MLLLLILDSTSVKSPRAKVPEMVALSLKVAAPVTVAAPSKVASPSTLKSLRAVTVPEVCPRSKSPVEKSPYNKFSGDPPEALPDAIYNL